MATDPVVDQAPTSVIEWSQETGIAWIGGVLAVLLLLHLLASWAEKKGWIYYRRGEGKGTGVAFSNALAEFEALLNPAAEHRIVEEQSQEILRSELARASTMKKTTMTLGRTDRFRIRHRKRTGY